MILAIRVRQIGMSFDSLKREAVALDPVHRRKLMAILASIQASEDDPDSARRLAEKLDSPERWIPIEDLEKELGISNGGQ